jgi:predicted nucleotidyltransferase
VGDWESGNGRVPTLAIPQSILYDHAMIDERQKTAVQEWCKKNGVRLALLFGSQATGKTHAKSDVDIAIWLIKPFTPDQKLQWLVELEAIFANHVSLVLVSPRLDPVLGFEIIKHGQILYEESEESWLKERSRLWHAYNDSLPFCRAAHAQLKTFLEEVQNGT